MDRKHPYFKSVVESYNKRIVRLGNRRKMSVPVFSIEEDGLVFIQYENLKDYELNKE